MIDEHAVAPPPEVVAVIAAVVAQITGQRHPIFRVHPVAQPQSGSVWATWGRFSNMNERLRLLRR